MSGDFNPDPHPDPLSERYQDDNGSALYEADIVAWERRNPRTLSEEKQALAVDLEGWWMDVAADEIAKTVPKAVEYGADDLIEIGRELVAAGVKDPGRGDEGYAELGIFFYEVGKMARWRSAIRRGDKVSDDTFLDFGVYIRMAQRVRSHGGWPGTTPSLPLSDHPTLRMRD